LITSKGNDAGTIQLHPKDYALDEVIIKAERPFAKVENATNRSVAQNCFKLFGIHCCRFAI